MAYVSASKTKKEFGAKQLRFACGENCKLSCSRKINEEYRQEILQTYWALADLDKQRQFIASHTKNVKPKYRYTTANEHRKLNNAFYFNINENKIRVCKAFFRATLDVNDRTIRTVMEKKDSKGFLLPDMRGKHANHYRVSQEIKDSVRAHIDSIPRIESH